jgi:hypothetical protein
LIFVFLFVFVCLFFFFFACFVFFVFFFLQDNESMIYNLTVVYLRRNGDFKMADGPVCSRSVLSFE